MTSGAAMSRSITQCSVASDRQFNFDVITTWLTYFIIFAWASLQNLRGYFVQWWCPVLIKTVSVIFPNFGRIKWDKLEAKCQFAGLLLVSNLEGNIVWAFYVLQIALSEIGVRGKEWTLLLSPPRPGPRSVIGGLRGMNNGL